MTFDAMNYRDGERRLTPAARESLDELTSAYRARLIEQAMIDNRNGEISALDFMRSVYSNPEADDTARTRARAERESEVARYRVYRARRMTIIAVACSLAVGTVLVVLAMTVFRTSILNVLPLVGTPALTIVALIIGRYFALIEERASTEFRRMEIEQPYYFGPGSSRFTPVDEDDEELPSGDGLEETNYRFMSQWQFLEQQLEELASRVLPDTGRRSIGTIIKQLTYDDTLTEYQADQIKRMLTVRNDLVHGGLPKNYALRDELREIMSVNDMLITLLDVAPPLSQTEKSARTVKRIVAKWGDDRAENGGPRYRQ